MLRHQSCGEAESLCASQTRDFARLLIPSNDDSFSGGLATQRLREPDQNLFGASNVAEPINMLVVDDLGADELPAVPCKPFEGVIKIIDPEHDT